MYKFCEITDVKQYMRIGASFTEHDTKIERLIELSTKEIQKFCNRTFIEDTYVEYHTLFDCAYGLRVWTKERPLQSAPTLRVSYAAQPTWDSVVPVPATEYRVDLTTGCITILFATYERPDSLQITYTGGYTVTDELVAVPDDINMACALQTSANLERLLAKDFGQKEKTERKGALNTKLESGFITGLLPQARKLVSPYVRMNVPEIVV